MTMLEILGHAFSLLCGQNPAHTWAPAGVPLPFCERCTGLYIGAIIGTVLNLGFRPKPAARFLEIHAIFLLLMIPLGFHWVPQDALLRTSSGFLFGAGLVAFLRLPKAGRSPVAPGSASAAATAHAKGLRAYWTGLLTSLVVLLGAARFGGRPAAILLTLAGTGGALALGIFACDAALRLAADAACSLRRRCERAARP